MFDLLHFIEEMQEVFLTVACYSDSEKCKEKICTTINYFSWTGYIESFKFAPLGISTQRTLYPGAKGSEQDNKEDVG